MAENMEKRRTGKSRKARKPATVAGEQLAMDLEAPEEKPTPAAKRASAKKKGTGKAAGAASKRRDGEDKPAADRPKATSGGGEKAKRAGSRAASGRKSTKTAKATDRDKPASAAKKRSTASAGKTAGSGKKPGSAAKSTSVAGKRAGTSAAKTAGAKKKAASAKTAKPGRAASMEAADELFPARMKPRGKAKGKRKPAPQAHRGLYAALSLLFATGIAAMALLGVTLVKQHDAFLEMKQVVEKQTFYDGTTVEGVDVSDMTLAAAREYWGGRVEPSWSQRTVTLDDGATLTAADLGYASDYDSVLYNAWSAGRSGSLEDRYHAALSGAAHPVAYAVRRRLYSEKAVDDFVRNESEKIDRPAVDAAVSGFDMDTCKFAFDDGQAGAKLDADSLKRDIVAALEAGGGSVTREIAELKPAVTASDLQGRYGTISTAVTNASSSGPNRLSNIKRALAYINGTCLEPGEVFSFNGVVGKRTANRGFKVATAYSSGDVTEELGGGICQVSTTLFNAAVKADLKIVERHNHSLTVAYVDSGKDATVNWDSQDLRFKNTTGDKVYVCCYLTKDKRVRVGIFGRLLENGERITVEAKTTGVIKFDTVYEPSKKLAQGETKVISPGKNGCKAVAYKVRWDATGNEIDRQVLCKSAYKAKNQVVAYGV